METPKPDQPRRGLHEDWTAALIGLLIFVGALLIALTTRPSGFGWDAAAPPALTRKKSWQEAGVALGRPAKRLDWQVQHLAT
jgi:hypothetical protein